MDDGFSTYGRDHHAPAMREGGHEPFGPEGVVLPPPPPPVESGHGGLPGWVTGIGVRLLLVGLIVGGGALWRSFGSADRDDRGAIVRSGDVQALDMRVGDCLDDPGEGEFDTVTGRPCAEPHDHEVFVSFTVGVAAYPSEDEIMAALERNCLPAFATYVGRAYEDSALDIAWFTPTEAGWQQGDHDIVCTLTSGDGSKLTGSMRGSQR